MFVLVHTNTIKNAERFIEDDINDPALEYIAFYG